MTNWKTTVHGLPELIDSLFDGEIDTMTFGKGLYSLIASQLREELENDDELVEIAEEIESFGERESWDYVDACLAALYDWADANLVWIDPIHKEKA